MLQDAGEAASSTSTRVIAESIAQGRTLREHLYANDSHWAHFVGSPEDVADEIERWVDTGWVDGFNYFVHAPEQWAIFREQVVPLLVKNGRFRADYDTETLRDHLGLPFIPNRHTLAKVQA